MNYISNSLLELEMDPTIAGYLSIVIMIFFIATLCIIANFITKKVVFRVVTHIVTNNKYTWDDMLLERRVFQRLSHIVPALIIYYF
ncbi:mechanosensitive ion channel family protein, partial [Neobacillus niacini]